MKTFEEFITESGDPLKRQLSGGKGADRQHVKTQIDPTSDFLKKITPKIIPTIKQNSSNISATDGTKTTREKQ